MLLESLWAFHLSWLIQFVLVPVPSLFIFPVFIVYKAWACWALVCCYSVFYFWACCALQKRELFAQVAFHSNVFSPKYVHNFDSEVLGPAGRFLPADPHVQNPIWSLKFCMDVEFREIDYTLRLLTCFLPVLFSFSKWLLALVFVVWSFHIKDR